MELAFDSLAQWLAEHQNWILIAIAGMAFLESLAVVGIIVPGVALLFAAGTAAGSSGISVAWVLAAAFAGAVVGDGLSFLLGYHYHNWIRRVPPFKSHPEWISKAENFFRQYGLMGIVIARFVGPIRPFMPMVAGFMQMKPLSFFSINILSAIAWAPFYLMPGYLVGASLEGDNALSGRHMGILLGMIFSGWLLAQLLWWAHQHIQQRRNKLQLAIITGLACCTLFIAVSQLMQLNGVIELNQQFAAWALRLRHHWLDVFFVSLTQLGYREPMMLWAATVSLAIAWQRNLYVLTLWVGVLLIGQFLLFSLKEAFAWPRPALIQNLPDSYAFPSGHTTMNLVFLGSLAILCLPGVSPRRQKAVLSGVCILIMTIAASRLYLSVHWPTDIAGGLLLGGLILSGLYAVVLKKPFRTIRPLPIVIASALAWLMGLGIWVIPHFVELAAQYQPLH